MSKLSAEESEDSSVFGSLLSMGNMSVNPVAGDASVEEDFVLTECSAATILPELQCLIEAMAGQGFHREAINCDLIAGTGGLEDWRGQAYFHVDVSAGKAQGSRGV